jgi:hypoxanthine phosphoribosyltransferase
MRTVVANLKSDLSLYITRDEIKKMVRTLARQIDNDYEGLELVVLCPLKGSVHFCADLVRELTLPLEIDFVQLYGASKTGAVRIVKDISANVTGKHVLIVEEIIDAARTLSFLRDRVKAANPASLKIVTLLDKPARRELPFRADYIGRTIEDRYVVGYGMDSGEFGRNYPDIYFLKN